MNNFEEKYKDFFKSVNLSDKEYDEIINNAINNGKTKSFKFKYAYILIIIVFVSFIGIVSASKIINYMKIDVNEEKGIKEITSEAVIDKDYDSKLFEDDNYYTYDEIEEKLGFKILKSNYYDSDLFKLNKVEVVDGKIASAIFNMVNSDKSDKSSYDTNISFSFKTNNSTKKPDFWIAGNSYLDKYFIKSLGVEAYIVYIGDFFTSAVVNFVYDNIFYGIEIHGHHGFTSYEDFVSTSKEKLKEDIIEVLESLTLE